MKKTITYLYDLVLHPRNYFRFRSYYTKKIHRRFLYWLYYIKIRDRVKYVKNLKTQNNEISFLLKNGYLKLDLTKEKELNDLLDKIVEESNVFFNHYKKNSSKTIYKEYLINLTTNYKEKNCDNLIKLEKNEKIVNLVGEYLDMLPTITFSAYWYSPFLKKTHSGSQLIHLDHEEFKQIKMFVYCSDVKIDNGPMHIINKKESINIQKKINYKTNEENKRLDDSSIDKKLIKDLSGNIKSIYLVDTSSCFHFGGRVSSGYRLMGVIQYLTPLSYNYKNLKKKLPVINKKNLI